MKLNSLVLALSVAVAAPLAIAVSMPAVAGGEKAKPATDIVGGAVASPAHTTLVAAVKAAELVDTLQGTGPFTVFAPTNSAFEALPAGTVDNLLKPENKATLASVLTFHVVAGNIDSTSLVGLIKDSGGKATVKTVQGENLTATVDDGQVKLTDATGNVATVTAADLKQSNGVIHVIDTVLLP